MITQRVYPSIHQAIYINLSGITGEIECSLLSSSKVSIRMGQLLLFIFTFFTTFIKQRAVCIIQINSFKRIIMETSFIH